MQTVTARGNSIIQLTSHLAKQFLFWDIFGYVFQIFESIITGSKSCCSQENFHGFCYRRRMLWVFSSSLSKFLETKRVCYIPCFQDMTIDKRYDNWWRYRFAYIASKYLNSLNGKFAIMLKRRNCFLMKIKN